MLISHPTPKILICRGKAYELPCLLSPEDYEWAVACGNWFVTHAVHPKVKKPGYAVRSYKGRLVFLHKEVVRRHLGAPPSPAHRIGDHWDGNTLNNQRWNLRWATPQMNAINTHGFSFKQLELDL